MSVTAPLKRTTSETTSFIYTATLKDETETVIPLASLTTLTLTLINKNDSSVINSRNAQNVLNTNQVTYHATSGLLTWISLAADSPIVDTTLTSEQHIAIFKARYGTGKGVNWKLIITVEQLAKVA